MKATEILSKIMEKVVSIESQLKVMEFQQKIILGRLDAYLNPPKINQPLLQPKKGEVVSPEQIEKQNENKQSLNISEPKRQRQISSKNNVEKGDDIFTVKEFTNAVVNNKEGVPVDSDRKVPVTQKIIASNGKTVSSAKIIIRSIDGDIIVNLTTSTSGRWQTLLTPGSYVATISGKYGQEIIEYSQSFEVPSGVFDPILLQQPLQSSKRYLEE